MIVLPGRCRPRRSEASFRATFSACLAAGRPGKPLGTSEQALPIARLGVTANPQGLVPPGSDPAHRNPPAQHSANRPLGPVRGAQHFQPWSNSRNISPPLRSACPWTRERNIFCPNRIASRDRPAKACPPGTRTLLGTARGLASGGTEPFLCPANCLRRVAKPQFTPNAGPRSRKGAGELLTRQVLQG